jgi:type II secretory ATPase GspE/PulE/Tfp pilus assembly ATPase PilB-like protein
MIIFCGPTGSGKTTSIYSLLEIMDKKSRNIMTLEDPVEYKISNVRQTEIRRGVIDFVDGIRSILRQDPDVIFIGEIRDEETAKMAIRASMTGHLVLTTVHSNDCFGAISRLREFNISDSMISQNIISIISQRLVRKYSKTGRTIVSEILQMSEEIDKMIHSGKNHQELLDYAIANKEFKTIADDCQEKIKKKIILEEDVNNILRISVN